MTADADLRRAMAAHQQGDRAGAADLYRRVLAKEKRNPDALHYFALLRAETGHLDEAAHLLRQAVRFGTRSADMHANLGRVYNLLNKHDEALQSYDNALSIDPEHPAALLNSAGTLLSLHLPDKALAVLDRLLDTDPSSSIALHNRCVALFDLGRADEAIATIDTLLARDSTNADTWSKRGAALAQLHRYEEATAAYEKSLALRRSAIVLSMLGNVNLRQGRLDSALFNYDEGIAADRNYSEAWYGRGKVLNEMRNHAAAFDAFDKAYTTSPDLHFVEGSRLHAKLYVCDWTNLDREIARLRKQVRDRKPAAGPFTMMAVSPSPAEQLLCAQTYLRHTYPSPAVPAHAKPRYGHHKIRVAYVSGEYHDQATSLLTVDLFESHDRSRFEVLAISTGTAKNDAMRRRLVAAFDEFFDAHTLSSHSIAKWIEEKEIDILVNLNGYFGHERTDIFLLRPAPIQVNYLGFPATMGAPWMDYIIADPILIEESEHACFAEKVVYLPDSYQPNDRRRAISPRQPTRVEIGLPESAFVFCCFNNTYKIMPDVFDIWMRILREVDASILWLLGTNPAAEESLRREAEQRSVAPERLAFAKRIPLPEHLARLQCADLFLDTLPCNAHTTASDALWAGVPVLTCRGSTFAGRVAESLLRAADLQELVTRSLDDYKRAAVAIAKDPRHLVALRTKLQRERERLPLFDTPRYARHIEAAFLEMWRRREQGQEPVSFKVEQIFR